MYIRKTHDEYDLIGDYGYGDEVILTEESITAAKKRLREYLENDGFVIRPRIIKRRVKNEERA